MQNEPTSVLCPNFKKGNDKNGNDLVTVVVQDNETRRILMVAYTDEAGYKETLETGVGVFWSRSRQKRWKKGEESGHTLRVHQILIDCDGDALVYIVTPKGPTCHTEAKSCFFRHATLPERCIEPAPKMGEKEKLQTLDCPVDKHIVVVANIVFELSQLT